MLMLSKFFLVVLIILVILGISVISVISVILPDWSQTWVL